jgi:hypothetical protein
MNKKMKKIIKLTESDLEKIIERVISESSNSVTPIEKTADQVQSSRQGLIDRWTTNFPTASWFPEIKSDKNFRIFNEDSLRDPNLRKMYDAYRTFFDSSVPSMDSPSEFYDWLKSRSVKERFHNEITKVYSDISQTYSLLRGMIPVLNLSQYPETVPYERALTRAQKTNPDIKKSNLFIGVHPVPKRAYETITAA